MRLEWQLAKQREELQEQRERERQAKEEEARRRRAAAPAAKAAAKAAKVAGDVDVSHRAQELLALRRWPGFSCVLGREPPEDAVLQADGTFQITLEAPQVLLR